MDRRRGADNKGAGEEAQEVMIQITCPLSSLVTMKKLLHSCMLRTYEIKSDGHSQQAMCYIEVKGDKVCLELLEDAYMTEGDFIVTMYGVFHQQAYGAIQTAIQNYRKEKNQVRESLSELLPDINL